MREKTITLPTTPITPPTTARISDSEMMRKKMAFLFAPIDIRSPISLCRSWVTIAAMSAMRGSAAATTNAEILFRHIADYVKMVISTLNVKISRGNHAEKFKSPTQKEKSS